MKPEITQKLAEISEIMSDAYQFTNVRFAMEDFEQRSKEGDDAACQILKIVENFHNLCLYIKQKADA